MWFTSFLSRVWLTKYFLFFLECGKWTFIKISSWLSSANYQSDRNAIDQYQTDNATVCGTLFVLRLRDYGIYYFLGFHQHVIVSDRQLFYDVKYEVNPNVDCMHCLSCIVFANKVTQRIYVDLPSSVLCWSWIIYSVVWNTCLFAKLYCKSLRELVVASPWMALLGWKW